VAATKSAKNPTDHNDTPNTPEVREGAIAKMKVDELRRKLRGHGVKGTAELKKPELVKRLIKAEVAATTKSSAAKRSTKNPTSGNDTPNTPGVSESAIAGMKADELRRKLRGHGVKGTAELKKPELVKRLTEVEVSATKAAAKKTAKADTTKATGKAATGKAASGKAASGKATGKAATGKAGDNKTGTSAKTGKASSKSSDDKASTGGNTGKASTSKARTAKPSKSTGSKKADTNASTLRTGKATSKSLKYSQEITSTEDKPERVGRSLVTTDHEVIRQWAKARKAVPSTVAGTEHDGHLGVLRFDFPGYSGDRLTAVGWDEWLATFDKRRLNFIYQQRQSNGKRSNFFRLENPDE